MKTKLVVPSILLAVTSAHAAITVLATLVLIRGASNNVLSLALQPDAKILAGGQFGGGVFQFNDVDCHEFSLPFLPFAKSVEQARRAYDLAREFFHRSPKNPQARRLCLYEQKKGGVETPPRFFGLKNF